MIDAVISYGGHDLATDYYVDFVKGTEPRMPPAQVATLERIGAWPVIVALQRNAQRLALIMRVTDYSNLDALRTQLFRWFDPEDETPKALIVENHAGVQMYVMALCEELRLFSDPRHQEVFVATLVVDGDVRWRSVTADSEAWAITATGQTHVFANGGEDEAYPVLTIEPTGAKTGGYSYRRWVPVVWRSRNAGAQYPLMATLDTAALTTAKMLANGDDLRVLVDGSETYRWLDAMDTAATKIWWSMDFTRAPDLALDVAIADSGTLASIQVDDEVELSLMPESGIVLIDDEAFVYTGRNLTDKQLTGISRAAKGTAAAAHTVGDTVHWIQHDVTLLYGNATATAPTVNNEYEPCFELDHSDNDTWVYEEFGDTGNLRAGRWQGWGNIAAGFSGGRYSATENAQASPYTVLGAYVVAANTGPFGWYLDNPCGIVNADWADGKRYASVITQFTAQTQFYPRGWAGAFSTVIAAPTNPSAWEAWSQAAVGGDFAVSHMIALRIYQYQALVEAGTVTVSLLATEVPLVTVNAEEGNYSLAATITNQSTGEAITITFVMDLASELEVNTDLRTVTWLEDGSRQFQAVQLSTVRRNWLRLLPGNNTLRWDDVGTNGVTLTLEWEERYY